MQLTEIRINLCPNSSHGPVAGRHNHHPGCHAQQGSRLRAFCSLTFDDTFVVRDVKLIEGNGGLFLAMPSRKLSDHCPGCGEKNHLRARFCNQCGGRLNEDRYLSYRHGNGHPNGNGATRLKLHADVAHPINARCRQVVERHVVDAYWREVERSKQPGYVPPSLDHEDFDVYDARVAAEAAPHPGSYVARQAEPALGPAGAVH